MSVITLITENIFLILEILMWSIVVFVPILVGVILAVYGDRKIWAEDQKRKGPNVVGPFGLFQVPADGLKYIFKEIKVYFLQEKELIQIRLNGLKNFQGHL